MPTLFVTGCQDKTLRLYFADQQDCLRLTGEHRGPITSLAGLNANEYLLTGCMDAHIRLFSVERLQHTWSKAQQGDVRYAANDSLMREFDQINSGVSHLCPLS